MEWYLQRESDFLFLNDQVALEAQDGEDSSSLLSDWCQWGFIRPEKFISPNIHGGRSTKSTVDEFTFDRQSPYVQVSKGPLVPEGGGSNSSAWGELPVDCSSRTLEAPVYGQPDLEMQSSMDWLDKVFLYKNSLLEKDNGNMQNALQSLEVQEPDLAVLVPAELSATNESEAVASLVEPKCFEAMVFHELEDLMIHLSGKMRICFRDSLYRLAKNSNEQHARNQHRSSNFINTPFMEVNSGSPSQGRSQSGESRTSVVDRTITNLIFNEPYFPASDIPCSPGSLHSITENLASPGSYYSQELPVQPQFY